MCISFYTGAPITPHIYMMCFYWFQLIFFKLVSLLFPTSDFRHPIVTPCLVFMSEILLRAHIKKYRSDISKGLFICTLILEVNIVNFFSQLLLQYKIEETYVILNVFEIYSIQH